MTGHEAENIFENWFKELGVDYEREHVAHDRRTARRSKGKCDFRKVNNNPKINFEIKHTTTGRISTSLAADKKIKPHQVRYLLQKGGYFGLVYSDSVASQDFRAYCLDAKDYIVLILDKKKSIKESDLKHRIECAEDLRRIIDGVRY